MISRHFTTSLSLVFLLVFMGSVTSALAQSPDESGIITSEAHKNWVKNNCQKTGETKERKYPERATYVQFECQNSVGVNLLNRGKSRRGVDELDQGEIDILYDIVLTVPDNEYFFNTVGDSRIDVKITHFGPNDRFITRIGAHNIKGPQVQGVESTSYTGYKLKEPITVTLDSNGQMKKKLKAKLTVKRPKSYDQKLNIFSAFVKAQYDKSITVWIKRERTFNLESTRTSSTVMTNEGVTLRLASSRPEYSYVVAGELETTLSVDPLRNQATIQAVQWRPHDGPDTRAQVRIKSFENLATNESFDANGDSEPSVVILSGEGDKLKRTLKKPDCQERQFKAQINYQVLEGKRNQEPRFKSDVKGIVLRNPSSSCS